MRVPLYICSNSRHAALRMFRTMQRMYSAISITFLVVTFATNVPMKFHGTAMVNFIYGMTTLTNLIHIYLLYKCQIILPSQTLQIDWDFENEVFLVRRPKGVIGGVATLVVQPENFKQLAQDQISARKFFSPDEKNCLYYDT